jgi:hypothetical protein
MAVQVGRDGLASAAEEFEQATLDSQVPSTRVAAEATLAAFAARADIIDISLSVIYQTNSAIARYHASTALRTAGLERWKSLSRDARYSPTDALRVRLVTFAVSRPIHSFERSAVLRAAAALTRRAYLEESKEERARFFEAVCKVAAQSDAGADVQQIVTALEMLSMLVAEFVSPSSGSASDVGLEREMLVQARALFSGLDGELFMAFRAANTALTSLVANPGERPAGAVRAVAHHALTALSDILTFAESSDDEVHSAVYGLHRGPEWHGVLLELGALVPRMFRLFDGFRVDTSMGSADVLRTLYEVMDATAVISRRSYPSAESADAVLLGMLRGVEERDWSASNPRQERLLYAELWRRFCVAHGLAEILRVAPGVLDSFAKNTVQLLRARSPQSYEAEEDWGAESDCLLLEAWAGLALQADSLGNAAAMQSHVASVVAEFIDQSLGRAQSWPHAGGGCEEAEDEEEDFGFDDESHAEAQLDAAAVLCRFASDACVTRLASLLAAVSKRVFLARGSGPGGEVMAPADVAALRVAQEDLVGILRLSSAVLADDGIGETPEVPSVFAQKRLSSGAGPLLGAVFATAELESATVQRRSRHGPAGAELSPRVEAAVLECLARVAKTYLLPASAEQEVIATFCMGGGEVAARARSMSLSKSVAGICERTCEPDVAVAAAELLLALAPGLSSARYPELCDSSRWEPLPSMGLEKFEPLPARAVEMVGTALSHYFADAVTGRLVQPASEALKGLGAHQGNVADASERALVALHMLCGVAQCAQAAPHVHESLVAAIRAPDGGAFVAARDFARANASVMLAVIKFARDVVACHMPLLVGDAAALCFTDCVSLVQATAAAVSGHVAEVGSDDVAAVAAASLKLLQRLLEAKDDKSIRPAAFFGLSLILPLLAGPVMAYPDVRLPYFDLVTQLVSAHPAYIPELPVEIAEQLLSSLQAGACQSYEEGVTRSGLEAVSAVAVFRVRNPHLAGAHLPSMPVLDRALEVYLSLILEGIMLGGGRFRNSLDAAADALLPLLLGGGRARALLEQAGRTLVSTCGAKEADTIAVLEAMATASREVAPVLGYRAGGASDAAPLAERHRARQHFAMTVHEFAATARLAVTSTTTLPY